MEVFPASGTVGSEPIIVEIVGEFTLTDPTDEFWYRAGGGFSKESDTWSTVPLFTTEEAITQGLAATYPGLYYEVTWYFFVDRHGIPAGEVGEVQDAIRRAGSGVHGFLENSSNSIRLDRVLDEYDDQILLARIPLFLMLFLVTGILIYYLALIAGLTVKSRTTEISMLKSRGAGSVQIGLLSLVEGLLLAVPAAALGPFIALGGSNALGGIFFDPGAGGDLAPVTLTLRAFLLGLAGAGLAVVVLTVSTMVAARQGIVKFHQAGARPASTPFFHRYYLDILVLVLIGFLWWQIQSRGSFLVRSVGTGDLEIDYSLLIGPVLALLAMGLLVLRFFPLVVALVSRLVEPVGPAWLVQGLRRVSRDPVVPGALVVLLMLATALGVIASAFSSTLERNQRDRALYAAGADLRIEHSATQGPVALLGVSEDVRALPEVAGASEVARVRASLLAGGLSVQQVSLLAVDTENFAEVAWFRDDFAGGKSLEELTGALAPTGSGTPSLEGIQLPEDATHLALWVRPSRPEDGGSLLARLRDARGYYFDVFLGNLDFGDWERLQAPLTPSTASSRTFRRRPTPPPPPVDPPYTLLSIQISNRAGAREPGALYLDRMAAITPAGEMPVTDFRQDPGWIAVEDYARPGFLVLESSVSVPTTQGEPSAAFSWVPAGIRQRRVHVEGAQDPMPAVVSRSFLEAAEARLGDTLVVSASTVPLPVRPVAVAEFFPTLDPRQHPFVVVDLKTFNHYVNAHNLQPSGGSNEIWLRLDGVGADAAGVIGALEEQGIRVKEASVSAEMVSARVERPLVNAGWGGLLVLMFLALVLASASGVMLFSYFEARGRQLEFALLHSMGLDRRQLNGVAWFTLSMVVIFGIGLGTWAGLQIGFSLLPLLEIAEEGVRVTPPMVLRTSWVTLLVSYLVLAGVAGLTVAWLAWFTGRLEVQRVLRLGQA